MQKIAPLLLFAILLLGCDLPLMSVFDLTPGEADGITIAHVSDLHLRAPNQLMDSMMEKLISLAPDVIAFTGDLVDSPAQLPLLGDYLDRLDPSIPKLAVPGNWEYKGGVGMDEFRLSLAAHGVTLLVNESITLDVKSTALNIHGLDDYLEGSPSFAGYTPRADMRNIVLAHCPTLFHDLISTYGRDAPRTYMFSGHTHGGQITLFGIPIYLPPGSGGYCSGRYTEGNHVLFISRGIGNNRNLDFRFFSDPELPVYGL